MAKRSSTVYLEDMFWNMISQYQEENNLSSRNDALAFMLKEWEMFNQRGVISIDNTIKPSKDTTITTEDIKQNENINIKDDDKLEVNPLIKNGMSQIFATIKEE